MSINHEVLGREAVSANAGLFVYDHRNLYDRYLKKIILHATTIKLKRDLLICLI